MEEGKNSTPSWEELTGKKKLSVISYMKKYKSQAREIWVYTAQ